MKQTIKQIAFGYAMRERACGKCDYNQKGSFCPFMEKCAEAYVRGFLKGRKYNK